MHRVLKNPEKIGNKNQKVKQKKKSKKGTEVWKKNVFVPECLLFMFLSSWILRVLAYYESFFCREKFICFYLEATHT